MTNQLADLKSRLARVRDLEAAANVLEWDQETYMPPAGAANRAEQASAIASIVHEKRTNPRIGELLAACERTQLASEAPDSSGVFTSTLIEVLRKSGGDLTYADLFVRCRAAADPRAQVVV